MTTNSEPRPYRHGGNVASTRVPYGTTTREARATLMRMVRADYPAARFYGSTTVSESRIGGLLVQVCCDLV